MVSTLPGAIVTVHPLVAVGEFNLGKMPRNVGHEPKRDRNSQVPSGTKSCGVSRRDPVASEDGAQVMPPHGFGEKVGSAGTEHGSA